MRHPSLLFVRLLKYNLVLVQNSLFLEAPPLVRVFRVVAFAGLLTHAKRELVHTKLFVSGVGFLTALCA